MVKAADLDAFIARRTAMDPDFLKLAEAELETRRLVLELAAERERQGLSQERVAAALGTRQPNVARLERGGVDPKHSSLVRYASLLGRRIALVPVEAHPAQPVQPQRTAQSPSSR
jgi:transcriptional regulator with XRE-family HTH domain